MLVRQAHQHHCRGPGPAGSPRRGRSARRCRGTRSTIGAIGTVGEVAGRCARRASRGVGPGVLGGVAARHGHAVHVLGTERRRRRSAATSGRVDAAGQPEHDRAEAVLADVVAQAGHQRGVHLGLVREPRRDPRAARARRPRPGPSTARCGGRGNRRRAPCGLAGLGAGAVAAGRSRSTTRQPSSNCGARADHARRRRRPPSSRRRRPARPGRRPCSRRRARQPASAARRRHQVEADVVLVPLVRRAVDDQQQSGAGRAGSAATGPPSCQRSSQIASAMSTPWSRTTAGGRRARSSGTRRRRRSSAGGAWPSVATTRPPWRTAAAFCGEPLGRPSRLRACGVVGAIEVADDDGEIAEPLIGQPGGERIDGAAGRLDERRRSARSSTGYPVSTISGKATRWRPCRRHVWRPLTTRSALASRSPDGGVDLGKGESELRHGSSVRCPRQPCGDASAGLP